MASKRSQPKSSVRDKRRLDKAKQSGVRSVKRASRDRGDSHAEARRNEKRVIRKRSTYNSTDEESDEVLSRKRKLAETDESLDKGRPSRRKVSSTRTSKKDKPKRSRVSSSTRRGHAEAGKGRRSSRHSAKASGSKRRDRSVSASVSSDSGSGDSSEVDVDDNEPSTDTDYHDETDETDTDSHSTGSASEPGEYDDSTDSVGDTRSVGPQGDDAAVNDVTHLPEIDPPPEDPAVAGGNKEATAAMEYEGGEEVEVATPRHVVRKSTRNRRPTDKAKGSSKGKEKQKQTTPDLWPPSDKESAVPPGTDETVVKRDPLLEDTYRDLAPLRVVSLRSQGSAGRTWLLSAWKADNGLNDGSLSFIKSLFAFKQHGEFVNLSRIDPNLLTFKGIGKSAYVTLVAGGGWKTVTCVSVVVVDGSHIGQPTATSSGCPKKDVTGYLHSQEFERFAGTLGAVFHQQTFWVNAQDSSISFGTMVGNAPGAVKSEFTSQLSPARAKQTTTASFFSSVPSPAAASTSSRRNVLPWDAVVPIYDYRQETVFNPAVHLEPENFARAIPSHLDLPKHSLAMVAYTLSTFEMTNSECQKGLSCNIMWAALLGVPANAQLPPSLASPVNSQPDRNIDNAIPSTPSKGKRPSVRRTK
ncbi:hypothetical protein BV22DRAFT_1134392 [Leucogyrophana mollusca]|uniref:Uncharacterized protein n=1 Tax=Leucogyrophana mollusca TaxID=85980 RepID=A0ACB8B0E9_9AGAM|nr:hypothetical protein BV22DRAFT_1134392 [Leucogyrophana mollusca]